MAAMAMDFPSPAPAAAKLPAPPYHHSPAAHEAMTPPPKPAGQRSPLPSPLQLSGSGYSLHDLLLLSPSPTSRRSRSKQRGAGVDSSLEMAGTPPRRTRRAAAPAGASPRNARRARRRLEKEVEPQEDAVRKARRRKPTWAAPKAVAAVALDKAVAAAAAAEKEEDMNLALVPTPADAPHVTGTDALEQSGWEGLWERIVELVMWKDVAKSALWFGLGSMFFFSCSFSREITFSPISAFCHLGVMILGVAFLKDSVPQSSQPLETGRNFRLTEEDLLRTARAVLPFANSLISTAQVIFSGNPSMTLKVLPVLLFGAKYGSLVTLWRLLATGFFSSFTLPKLYMCYSTQIHRTVENVRDRALEAWKSCPRKKLVAGTAVTMCWNLFSIKTRFVAAFISVVILRYNRQHHKADVNPEVKCCQEDQEQEMEVKP
ncbi:reticulon-like protein B18 isoform X1 [Lolium perenne]|uniref:reticulon-like protein B18 isoform X1 n=1 Tax=Lolium perenne TaxID=4522 RepID=UPI0021F5B031|nr:reticulon-like protein B18 isoform X1 [Lolium perenne]